MGRLIRVTTVCHQVRAIRRNQDLSRRACETADPANTYLVGDIKAVDRFIRHRVR